MGRYTWVDFRGEGHRLVVTAVRAAERLSKGADRLLRPWKLTLAQFNLLAVLLGEPGGLPQNRIGERLVVSRANVTGLVRRLKARGLVRVLGDEDDARIKRIQATPEGIRLMGRLEQAWFREVRRVTGRHPESALRAASDLLESLRP